MSHKDIWKNIDKEGTLIYNLIEYYITYNIKQEKILYFELVNLRRDKMVFNTGAALLDAIVLSVVSKSAEGTYGYKITQDVRQAIEISESTLYPVLRRLQKDDCLETYDRAIDGRNRRYYKITEAGRIQLNLYRGEWNVYAGKISEILKEG